MIDTTNSRTLRLFYITGDPNGIRAASVVDWPGSAVAVPRQHVTDFKKRPEASRPGVYILLGDNPNELGEINGYVGETETLWKRINDQARDQNQDWWTEVIVLTSHGDWFNKAHAKHLEREIWKRLVQAGSIKLTNTQEPSGASLSEEDLSDANVFLRDISFIITPLSMKAAQIFQPKSVANTSGQEFVFSSSGAKARLIRSPDGYVILKGSTAVKESSNSMPRGYRARKESFIADGMLAENGANFLVFTDNAVLASSSAAAAIVAGISCNGPQSWKTSDGRTLCDVEANDSI